MSLFPHWEESSHWPYLTDDSLLPGESDCRDKHEDDIQTSLSPTSIASFDSIGLHSPLLFSSPHSSIPSLNGYSVPMSDSDSNIPAELPSSVIRNQHAGFNVAENSPSSCSELLPSDTVPNLYGGGFWRVWNLYTDHKFNSYPYGSGEPVRGNWQPDVSRYNLAVSDPTSRASILEDVHQANGPKPIDGNRSAGNAADNHTELPQPAKDTQAEVLHIESCATASSQPLEDGSAPTLPISDVTTLPKAHKATKAKRVPGLNKSTGRAKCDHSHVEKRYRFNLNSALVRLQQCVPALNAETIVKKEPESPDTIGCDSKQDSKLQKGIILSGATDYIQTLKASSVKLESHIELLQKRVVVLQEIALGNPKGAEGSESKRSSPPSAVVLKLPGKARKNRR